jgi:hypothetical protein
MVSMPRPRNKDELLVAIVDGFQQLNAILDALTPAQRDAAFPFQHRDKNVRDVLAHLHEWQLLMTGWYKTGMGGAKPDMPAKGFTWKTTPELNATIWSKYQNTSLKRVRNKLTKSHDELCKIVAKHSNDELFLKCYYFWTGSTSLGSYVASATSSHYDWASKLLRRFAKAISKPADNQAVNGSRR